MEYELYEEQIKKWPDSGKHIMANYDDEAIVVYQAYRPEIAEYAIEHQRFGGQFSFGRMSWIKPNFLWMMFRCGWAQKPGQEMVLGIRIKRSFFDEILGKAVYSSFNEERYELLDEWKKDVQRSSVRLQWDPDHDPFGVKISRRAVQLGLRNDHLKIFAIEAVVGIEDMTPFVIEQKKILDKDGVESLMIPSERVYKIDDISISRNIGLTI